MASKYLKIGGSGGFSAGTSFNGSIVGFGTVSDAVMFYSKSGKVYHLFWSFTSGTPTAVTAELPLPDGVTLSSVYDTTLSNKYHIVGGGNRQDSTQFWTLADGGDDFVGLNYHGIGDGMNRQNGNAVATATNVFTFWATVIVE